MDTSLPAPLLPRIVKQRHVNESRYNPAEAGVAERVGTLDLFVRHDSLLRLGSSFPIGVLNGERGTASIDAVAIKETPDLLLMDRSDLRSVSV